MEETSGYMEIAGETKKEKYPFTPEITIKIDGTISRILIDGKEIKGISGYELRQDGRGVPQLHLSLLALNVTVDSALVPALPEVYQGYYVSKRRLIDTKIATEEQLDSM